MVARRECAAAATDPRPIRRISSRMSGGRIAAINRRRLPPYGIRIYLSMTPA